MTIRGNNSEYQLQLWNGKTYEPLETLCNVNGDSNPRKVAEYLADAARAAKYVAWRVVDVSKNWPLKPRAPRRPVGFRYDRTDAQVIADYMGWAVKQGLKVVHVYSSGCRYWQGHNAAREHRLAYIEVEPESPIIVDEADYMPDQYAEAA